MKYLITTTSLWKRANRVLAISPQSVCERKIRDDVFATHVVRCVLCSVTTSSGTTLSPTRHCAALSSTSSPSPAVSDAVGASSHNHRYSETERLYSVNYLRVSLHFAQPYYRNFRLRLV